jgi:hypothetical protein
VISLFTWWINFEPIPDCKLSDSIVPIIFLPLQNGSRHSFKLLASLWNGLGFQPWTFLPSKWCHPNSSLWPHVLCRSPHLHRKCWPSSRAPHSSHLPSGCLHLRLCGPSISPRRVLKYRFYKMFSPFFIPFGLWCHLPPSYLSSHFSLSYNLCMLFIPFCIFSFPWNITDIF